MKAILIDPKNQRIEAVDVAGIEDISHLIGFDTLASDAVGNSGDRLYFDEECFLRGTSGRFQIDTVIPVSGIGILTGTAVEEGDFQDVHTDIEDLKKRIKYL